MMVNLGRLAVLVTLLAVLGACGTKYVAQSRLDETLRWYQSMLEKGDFEATGLLASDSIAQDYQDRARGARDVRVVGCRILRVDYVEATCEADVTIEIEYYSLQTLKAKTIRQLQKWACSGDKGSHGWRLMTLLPVLN
jgi:hypothetical protein